MNPIRKDSGKRRQLVNYIFGAALASTFCFGFPLVVYFFFSVQAKPSDLIEGLPLFVVGGFSLLFLFRMWIKLRSLKRQEKVGDHEKENVESKHSH